MVSPLPRYEPLGVRVAPVQGVSSAGAEGAARAASTLADNLTRLSNFAFAQAEERAKIEGAEYGAANAPTLEQLQRAQESGEPLPAVADTGSVFGRAARAGALIAMQQNIEIEARGKIAQLHAEARQKEMPLDQYRAQLDNIVVGYSTALAQVSPRTAGSVRASLSTVASSQFVQHSDWLLQKQVAQQKIAVAGAIDGVVRGVDAIVQAGDRVSGEDGDERLVPVESILAAERTKILQFAQRINDPALAKTKLKEFQEAVDTAQRGQIVAWTRGEDGVPTLAKYDRVMRGDLTGTHLERAWAGMSEEQRTKAKDEVRRQMKAQLDLEGAFDVTAERNRRIAQGETRVEFIAAWRNGDAAGQRTAIEKMQQNRDAEGYEKFAGLVDREGSPSAAGEVFRLENELARGTLTRERVMDRVASRNLSYDDARKLLDKVDSATASGMTEALTVVKNSLGYPDRAIINPGAAERRAMQQVTTIHNEMIAARRLADAEGKPFDAYQYGRRRVEEIKSAGPSAEELRAAETRLNGLKIRLGLKPEATVEETKAALATATARRPNERGYFNPAQAPVYLNDIEMLTSAGGRP
jgi:hypothetical protein